MLLFLCGPSFVGKRTIADYLVENEHFQTLQLITDKAKTTDSDHEEILAEPWLRFKHIEEIENFIMMETRWSSNWVLLGTLDADQFHQLRKRPFVLTVAVDAPLMLRCKRSRREDTRELAEQLDAEKYPPSPLAEIMVHADLTLINDATDTVSLKSTLAKLQLANPERIRPSWDTYFMHLCHFTAHRSNCMKRRVGALLTSDRRILATGYNGTPFGTANCFAGGCPRCNTNARAGTHLDTCFCLHAEENTLLGSDRGGSAAALETTLYCTTFPCIQCAKKIVQCKVRRVVYARAYAPNDALVHAFLVKSGVQVQAHAVPRRVVFTSEKGFGLAQ